MLKTAMLVAGLVVGSAAVVAQERPPVEPAPASKQPAKEAEKKSEPPAAPEKPPAPPEDLPTLDELLGTGETTPAPEEAELDRLLSGEELGQAFQQAVRLMGDAAGRLTRAKDVSLTTQRVQEDALRKLDQLISSLDKQSQSQSQSQSQGEQDQSQGQPRQRRPQQGQPSESPASGEPEEHEGPSLQEGPLNPELESARAAWGALPARVRQMLMQGSNDRFSAMYNRMTQEYYRRLAEESSARP